MNFSLALDLAKKSMLITISRTNVFWKIINHNIVAFSYMGGKQVVNRFLTSYDILSNNWETFREIDFKDAIISNIKLLPKDWREGQKVFNYIDSHYGNIARRIQLEKRIDCFYNNDNINEFISESYKLLIYESSK